MRKKRITYGLFIISILFSSCVNVRVGGEAGAPPVDPSETVVEANGAAAELLVEPDDLQAGEKAVIRVANRGTDGLMFGRPILVEKWDGGAWRETEDSRNTMWTMELLHAEAGATGAEQFWPFSDSTPEPGWYRFSKSVNPAAGDSEAITIRGRVRVSD